MADILKNRTDRSGPDLLPQQKILDAGQGPLVALVDEMIPATGVAIQHGGRLEELPAVGFAAFALEGVVGVAGGVRLELEQFAEGIDAEMALDVLGAVDDAGRERLLVALPLEDLLLDRARRDEAVDEAILLLAVAPHARERLLVRGRVPVRVEEDEPVGADEVEAAAAGLGAEEEDELVAGGVVELVDQLLALVDVHGAVEAEDAVVAGAAELVEDVERLGVVAYQHDFVVGVLPDAREHAVEDGHFARVPCLHVAVAATGVFGDVVGWEEGFGAGEVGGEVKEVGVVAEFFKHADCFEGLGAFAAEEELDVGGLDEEVVEVFLEGGEVAEHDVFVFDGEVFGEDVVGAADDEFVDEGEELGQAFIAFLAAFFCCVGIATSKDGKFIFLSEVVASPQVVGVGKVEEGEIFHEIVLNRSAGEDDSPIDIEAVERSEGLAFSILETMTFVAEKQSNRSVF